MIAPNKVFEQVSEVIQNSLNKNKTSYFPNKEKLIQAFEYYVYFKYTGKVDIGNAIQTFLMQINWQISFRELSKQELNEVILVLFSVIESFPAIEEIRQYDLNIVQLRFQQLAKMLEKKENNRKQKRQLFQGQTKDKDESYFINEEGLLKLMFEKGIQKEIKNNSSLMTPQMTFHFLEIQEDRNSILFDDKSGLY